MESKKDMADALATFKLIITMGHKDGINIRNTLNVVISKLGFFCKRKI